MKKDGITTLKVAAAYIGTIVGAGFATGQEILQFFSGFGILGLAGLVVSAVLFVLFGYIIMRLGRDLTARSHMEIIRYSGGKVIGTAIDVIITFFLFGALTAMIAGTGALFSQQFNLPEMLGNFVMAALTAATVLTGIHGVINAISFVVPFLLVAVTGTSIYAIIAGHPDLPAAAAAVGQSGLIKNWLLAAVLYVSYNTLVSVAVLGPLGVEARGRRAIRNGAVLGGIGLGLGAIMIFFALSGYVGRITELDIPMVYIAGTMSTWVQTVYAVVLIAEIYTTAVGSLYGFASRLEQLAKSGESRTMTVIAATYAALAASQFGFVNLVKYLYPAVGYGGLILLICLTYAALKNKTSGAGEAGQAVNNQKDHIVIAAHTLS